MTEKKYIKIQTHAIDIMHIIYVSEMRVKRTKKEIPKYYFIITSHTLDNTMDSVITVYYTDLKQAKKDYDTLNKALNLN